MGTPGLLGRKYGIYPGFLCGSISAFSGQTANQSNVDNFFCQNREKEERERRIKEIEEMRKRVRKEKSLQSWQYQWKLEILTLLEYNYISSK